MKMRYVKVYSVLLAAIGLTALVYAQDQRRFKADLQTTSSLGPAPVGRCDDELNNVPVLGLLTIQGAGDATFLGPVFDEQSHCVRADLTFFNGKFTLTAADGDKVWGRYFGQLEPTITSTITASGPGGQWLIVGSVCI